MTRDENIMYAGGIRYTLAQEVPDPSFKGYILENTPVGRVLVLNRDSTWVVAGSYKERPVETTARLIQEVSQLISGGKRDPLVDIGLAGYDIECSTKPISTHLTLDRRCIDQAVKALGCETSISYETEPQTFYRRDFPTVDTHSSDGSFFPQELLEKKIIPMEQKKNKIPPPDNRLIALHPLGDRLEGNNNIKAEDYYREKIKRFKSIVRDEE